MGETTEPSIVVIFIAVIYSVRDFSYSVPRIYEKIILKLFMENPTL